MTLEQFLSKCNISQRDTFTAKKIWKGLEKSQEEWTQIFNQNFNYSLTSSPVLVTQEIEVTDVVETEKVEEPKEVLKNNPKNKK